MEVSHQPDSEPDNHSATFKMRLFIPLIKEIPGESVKQLLQSGDIKRRDIKRTVWGYSLIICPFWS